MVFKKLLHSCSCHLLQYLEKLQTKYFEKNEKKNYAIQLNLS